MYRVGRHDGRYWGSIRRRHERVGCESLILQKRRIRKRHDVNFERYEYRRIRCNCADRNTEHGVAARHLNAVQFDAAGHQCCSEYDAIEHDDRCSVHHTDVLDRYRVGDDVADDRCDMIGRFGYGQKRLLNINLKADGIDEITVSVGREPEDSRRLGVKQGGGYRYIRNVPALPAADNVRAGLSVNLIAGAERAARIERAIILVQLRGEEVVCEVVRSE
ncbi:hypothetical protein D3C84_831270 [compost metagenome]